MKRILITSVLALFALALPGTANAQAKKAPAKSAEKAPAKPADGAAPAPAEPAPAPAAAPAADAKPADAAAPDAKPAPPEKPKAAAPKKGVKQGTAGKVTAVDAEKKTITIGKMVYLINDETQYVNKEAPAQLTDVVAGTNVGFSYTADKAGKRTLVKVNVGVKQDAPKAEGKEKAAEGEKPADGAKPAETAKPKTGTKKGK
jgi:hypothetical protein